MPELQHLFNQQKKKSYALKTSTIIQRKASLLSLKKVIQKYEFDIIQALKKDFRKPEAETLVTEIFPVMSELNHTLRNLKKWSKPKKLRVGPLFIGTESYLQTEPKGVVLIISPWNYPFLLTFQPLISAIAAGNTVLIKPSEISLNTSALMKQIIDETFASDHVCVLEGDKILSQELLKLPFDHIFFTGSTTVGQYVMEQAAKNLVPVTLELGGKSPAIIADDFDLEEAAEKLIWGKVLNLGQTCVAPDYVFIPEYKKDQFIEFCLKQIKMKTENQTLPLVINQAHHERLLRLLENAQSNGANIFPTLTRTANRELGVHLISLNSQQTIKTKIMQEEIFGPLLPILTYSKIEEAIDFICQHDHPLSLYIFSNQSELQKKILAETYSGDALINDLIIHFGNHSLPIGGIGKSGMGKYHGLEGFQVFSHRRTILKRKYFSSLFRLLYPPYKNYHLKLFRFFIRMGL